MSLVALSFCACLFAFTAIGLASAKKSVKTADDYLLAGRNVAPWLAGLSAVATNNSGFMFTGMIGYTYSAGLSSIWIIVPWLLGDFLASRTIHQRLRVQGETRQALTFPTLISSWRGHHFRWVRIASALLIVVFLGTYAAAQLTAGSKALHVLFGWNYNAGAVIGGAIVLAYCLAGGIRASIWTDAAQSIVMVSAMALLCVTCFIHIGGWDALIQKLSAVSPTYLHWFPDDLMLGTLLGPLCFVFGWMAAGWGVIGQPHIMVRFMAIDKPEHMRRTRGYYYGWYVVFCALTLACGFAARALLPGADAFDSELALPTLAQQFLPDILVGLVLAGLFAATMSTADSQILSCSAAFSHDLRIGNSYIKTKLSTLFVTLVALSIALWGNDSVFVLVLISWSALGSAFAPLITVYAWGGAPSERTALAMMGAGIAAMLLWRAAGLDGQMFEILPGMAAGFAVYGLSRLRQ